jgi:hypothetical protein
VVFLVVVVVVSGGGGDYDYDDGDCTFCLFLINVYQRVENANRITVGEINSGF